MGPATFYPGNIYNLLLQGVGFERQSHQHHFRLPIEPNSVARLARPRRQPDLDDRRRGLLLRAEVARPQIGLKSADVETETRGAANKDPSIVVVGQHVVDVAAHFGLAVVEAVGRFEERVDFRPARNFDSSLGGKKQRIQMPPVNQLWTAKFGAY